MRRIQKVTRTRLSTNLQRDADQGYIRQMEKGMIIVGNIASTVAYK